MPFCGDHLLKTTHASRSLAFFFSQILNRCLFFVKSFFPHPPKKIKVLPFLCSLSRTPSPLRGDGGGGGATTKILRLKGKVWLYPPPPSPRGCDLNHTGTVNLVRPKKQIEKGLH